jgi:hypothetical protein
MNAASFAARIVSNRMRSQNAKRCCDRNETRESIRVISLAQKQKSHATVDWYIDDSMSAFIVAALSGISLVKRAMILV